MYLIEISLDTLVRVTLEAGAVVTPSLTITDRNALHSGEPLRLRTIIRYLEVKDIASLTLVLPEGTHIEVDQPRKFTLPFIREFMTAQSKEKGGN